MQRRKNLQRTARQYLGILIGTLITALGLNTLLIPNRIAAGGASGIATILHYLIELDPGLTILLINVPLLILSGIFMGWKYSWYSILGGLITSGWVTLTSRLAPLTDVPLLGTLYGGVVTGIGMGIVFRSRGSTGGTDVAAQLINHFTGWPVGQALLVIDGIIVAAAALIFGTELAMYALIAIFVTTRVIDWLQEGFVSVKALLVISDANEAIATAILHDLGRGATFLHGEGGYSRHEKRALLVVVDRSELTAVKELVHRHDERAFVIVVDAREVLGEGFSQLSTTI
ncbi:MAG: YitT family protein [Bacillota bacterium]|jgi:uncharacterized membrane-anchored protein YitT (DUF2179 family)